MAFFQSLSSHSEGRMVRHLDVPHPVRHCVQTLDGVELTLARYEAGNRGPVILVPGLGTSSELFLLNSTDQNLVEHLCAADFDVWVLNHRASPELPASNEPSDFDYIAAYDYPAAIRFIRERTACRDVQVVAHCVGGATLMMALLSGMQNVRSAICSQFAVAIDAPLSKQMFAWSHTDWMLRDIAGQYLSDDSHFLPALADQLTPYCSSNENCGRTLCGRVLLLYGEAYKHAQLNQETHDKLATLFGLGHERYFNQLYRMVEAGTLVNAAGQDVYLPHAHRINMPITILHAEDNGLFRETGGRRSYDWLRMHAPSDQITYYAIPDYGHTDCLIGHDAAWDVYPLIAAELNRYN